VEVDQVVGQAGMSSAQLGHAGVLGSGLALLSQQLPEVAQRPESWQLGVGQVRGQGPRQRDQGERAGSGEHGRGRAGVPLDVEVSRWTPRRLARCRRVDPAAHDDDLGTGQCPRAQQLQRG